VKFNKLVCVALSVAVIGSARASAQTHYAFRNIADSNGAFRFLSPTSINNGGTVAFLALLHAGGEGIFTGSGGSTITIASDSGPTLPFGNPSINDSGTVVFNSHSGILIGSGGSTTTIADTSGQFAGFRDPSINDSGTVAFAAFFDVGGSGIFTGSGGSITTIVDSSGEYESFTGSPSINAGGTIVFTARLDDGGQGIFTEGGGGPTVTIADIDGGFSGFGLDPSINNGGTVAFTAGLSAGAGGIFTGSGGPTTTVADTSGPFKYFSEPWINDSGMVAFAAGLDDDVTSGIFTGDDPVTDKVIQTGDMLFGRKVFSLGFGRGLNDRGDIAFLYVLTDGVRGIAVASLVPEPSAFAIAMAASSLFAFGFLRRRQIA
jgi:hypothetical protein